MRKFVAGLLALVLTLAGTHMRAFAGKDTIDYEPGVLEAAIAKGQTVLIHYKTTW